MAYPTGVSLAIIEAGQAGTFFGDGASITAKVTPVLSGTPYIVHTTSGYVMVPAANTFSATEGGTLSFSVPHTDQAGWQDSAGNAFTGWAYRVDITITIGGGSKATRHTWVKNVQPIVGQNLIDLDLVIDGAIGEPVSAPMAEVLSVNGVTGHVTLDVSGASDTDIAAFVRDPASETNATLDANYAPKLTELHVFVAAGQSNMSGRGTPAEGSFDPLDYRIYQYGANNRTFRQATVPLDMVDVPSGLSPATVFAREYLRRQPMGVGVLLVPAAMGASGLIRDEPTGVWDPTYTGTNAKLYDMMLTQVSEAVTAASTATGITPVEKGFLWLQGEAETASGAYLKADYAAAFDRVIDGVRTARALPSLPVAVGGMVPEYIETTGNGGPIREALLETSFRLQHVGYAEGVRNGGGSASVTDKVHYHREGVEVMGRRMVDAYYRALSNATGSIPVPPQNVSASFLGGTLRVLWERPLCRVTDYRVEYKVDDAAWVTVTGRTSPVDTRAVVAGLTGTTVRVRVATVNGSGTSSSSTAIVADGVPVVNGVPVAPEPVLLTGSNITETTIDLAWEMSPNVYQYEIWRSQTSGGVFQEPVKVTARANPTTTITLTGLEYTRTYRHYLVLTNASGQTYTTNVIEHTPPAPAPSASTLTTSNVTASEITLNWTETTDTDSYEIWRQVDSGGTWGTASKVTTRFPGTTTLTVTNLASGTSYRHWIRSVGPGGSTDSNFADATTL